MADENWALTMRDLTAGSGRGAFLLGSGIAMWVFWVGSTVVGRSPVASSAIPPATASTSSSQPSSSRSPPNSGRALVASPWLVALGVAVAAAELVPGRWYILLGGLAAAELVPGRWYILLGGLAAAVVEVIRYDG